MTVRPDPTVTDRSTVTVGHRRQAVVGRRSMDNGAGRPFNGPRSTTVRLYRRRWTREPFDSHDGHRSSDGHPWTVVGRTVATVTGRRSSKPFDGSWHRSTVELGENDDRRTVSSSVRLRTVGRSDGHRSVTVGHRSGHPLFVGILWIKGGGQCSIESWCQAHVAHIKV